MRLIEAGQIDRERPEHTGQIVLVGDVGQLAIAGQRPQHRIRAEIIFQRQRVAIDLVRQEAGVIGTQAVGVVRDAQLCQPLARQVPPRGDALRRASQLKLQIPRQLLGREELRCRPRQAFAKGT